MSALKKVGENLYRNPSSGTYFARIDLPRGSLWKSLKTTRRTVADLRLPAMKAKLRAKSGTADQSDSTLSECEALYLEGIDQNKYLKPRAKEYRRETFVGIRATFPGFDEFPAADASWHVCRDWADKARQKYSGSRFNGMLQSFRGVLDIAVRHGCLDKNPFRDLRFEKIKHAKVLITKKPVYTFDQMDLLFAELKRRSLNAHHFCRFLYHFTLRVDTAARLTPAMVNRDMKQFEIPGEIVKGEREDTIIYAPIFPEMAELLDEMDDAYGARRDRLLPIKGCLATLQRARLKLNLPKIHHHLFRHNFTSHALLKGVSVQVLAGWLNHKDGGALLLRRYSHIIDNISREQASTLKLRNSPEEKIHVLKTGTRTP